MKERERDLLLPSHHQQVGEKGILQQPAVTIVPPAHLLIVTTGWGGGNGEGGGKGKAGAEVRRRRGGH